MKVFISQPMNGKTNEEIKAERKKMTEYLNDVCNEDYEIIDSFFENAPHDANPIWFLGKSIELLSQADMVLFAPGWEKARGCRLEHEVCVQYAESHFIETHEF